MCLFYNVCVCVSEFYNVCVLWVSECVCVCVGFIMWFVCEFYDVYMCVCVL